MPYEQRELSGSVFPESSKASERHPDHKGSALIAGVEYWVSAWNKTSRNGKPFLSLAFTAKQEQRAAPERDEVAPWEENEPEEELGF